MKKFRITFFIISIFYCCFSLSFATPTPAFFNKTAPKSLADHLHVKPSTDPIDGGWLPNLTGLPNEAEIELIAKRVEQLIATENESKCRAIEQPIRRLMFQHFLIYQTMANRQNIYLDTNIAHQWAHVLGMILKESSGDTAAVSDMLGHELSVYKAQTNLSNWRKIEGLSRSSRVSLNYQTNFGLTQTSADRLFAAFRLASQQEYDTEFLEGLEGAASPRKVALNTAIAIRRLIWFYQDFAQGRITQEDTRIHRDAINYPEFSARYQEGLRKALIYCGSRLMFYEGKAEISSADYLRLKDAMTSIAYCKLGNAQSGYGRTEIGEKCFAKWVTLCPALNVDIATLTPLSYFQTRNEKPVCEATFKKLLNIKPKK